MNLFKTFLSGVLGTSTMTLFSYAASEKQHEQFKEPVLLHKLFRKGLLSLPGKRSGKGNRLDGWLLHYIAGFLFSTAYDRIWNETKVAPTIPSGIVLGAISGLAGIAIWDLTFRMHPDPPKVNIKDYYKHLMAAHVVFGVFAALGYRAPEGVKEVAENEEEIELGI